MRRTRRRRRWWLAVPALGASLVACGGDDTAEVTIPPTIAATDAPTTPPTIRATTTEAAATTVAPDPTIAATTAPTVAPTPPTSATATTIDDGQLAQDAADAYLATQQLREDMVLTPSLDRLEERAAMIAPVGSLNHSNFVGLIQDLVASDERVITNTPDYSDDTVERVDVDPTANPITAVITVCQRNNLIRVDASGSPVVAAPGTLFTVRAVVDMILTPEGWRQGDSRSVLWEGQGVAECAPA